MSIVNLLIKVVSFGSRDSQNQSISDGFRYSFTIRNYNCVIQIYPRK